MAISYNDLIVLRLIQALREHDSWCGETHIQKALYCLQEITIANAGYPFILYKHGPYSFELHDELAQLRFEKLLMLEIVAPPYGPRINIGENGRLLIGDKSGHLTSSSLNPKMEHDIEFIAGHLATKGVAELERIATALFVTKESGNQSVEERASHIVELKPHIKYDDAIKAIREVENIEHQYQISIASKE